MVCQKLFFMNTDIGPSSDLVWVINLVVISQWKSNVNVKTTLKYRQNIFRHQPCALPEWLFGFGMKIYRPITHSGNDKQRCPAECLEGRSCRTLRWLLKHFGPAVEVKTGWDRRQCPWIRSSQGHSRRRRGSFGGPHHQRGWQRPGDRSLHINLSHHLTVKKPHKLSV